ncbi:NAD+-dep alpha-L-aminoadipate semialdehyde (or delta-1-piperideine-6-carboxylate) dehydrogenase [Psychroflexus torquis ATCC 700755]|uniref:aldehyde dehydrogenase (NAD(+)) n=1 Tax=Psychroflexus torquis (strain ATCC 700755 / CIP 106069 / ACAM 623) TaxID=313595 RepID=K4IG37_PSYTT|nr:aldehyde dehydrogenase family protein [Psychroflexus torquis]AFU68783.1 NAD+-dep alpha-L-aminoadipate semialdehyde (or delta-1-piperideine-6-carboxylate) dehydrogenase [Psychroflexus torquis ATCC 700755]
MSHISKEFGIDEALKQLDIQKENKGTSIGKDFFASGEMIESFSPVDGASIGKVQATSQQDYEKVASNAHKSFKEWRTWPAPARGEVVRQLNDEFRRLKAPLGKLVSYEMGKSYQEGLGEVQEMIDICDFAVGLSRQLHGFTMHSERPGHRMYEQWHPLGVVGIISAFNFPVAVWSWNTALAWVCGDACIWKGSEKTPLTSVACQKIAARVFEANGVPEGISSLITGDHKVGEYMTQDKRTSLVSATGSIKMGKIVAQEVAKRLGKSLLELGGNNAIIVTPDADIKNTVIGAVFGAVGTCGQRCTSTRRIIIHESIYDKVKNAIVDAYKQIRIGNPLDENNHVGPLIDKDAVKNYLHALEEVKREGGKILVEGGVLEGEGYESGCYVKPAIAEAENHFDIVQHETFAPVLYIMKYSGEVDNALELQNGVVQGLSSAIMTNSLREAEMFLSVEGSDCGIANVNIGTSGAEIGGAFGGEKETGGGRESGSDAWKVYMRRQTNTINYTKDLPLAQGIKFDL